MGSIFKYLVFIPVLFWASTVWGQEKKASRLSNIRIKEKGIVLGSGYGIDTFNLPQGNYIPIFCIARIGIDFRNKESAKTNKGEYSIFFEPQINPVLLKKNQSIFWEFEYGLNIGFQHMFPITPSIYSSIFISTGPHYFSADTDRQAPGFIFSDNFGAGIYYFISKDFAINIGFRLRHMSNAQTRLPNSGINTFNFAVGIGKLIKK